MPVHFVLFPTCKGAATTLLQDCGGSEAVCPYADVLACAVAQGYTALHHAVEAGQDERVQILLCAGADTFARDEEVILCTFTLGMSHKSKHTNCVYIRCHHAQHCNHISGMPNADFVIDLVIFVTTCSDIEKYPEKLLITPMLWSCAHQHSQQHRQTACLRNMQPNT